MKPTKIKTKSGEELVVKKSPIERFMEGKRYSYSKRATPKPTQKKLNPPEPVEETPKQKYIKKFLRRILENKKGPTQLKKTIACVLRKSKEYDVDYVEHLVKGIKGNLHVDAEIVCISDTNVSHVCKQIEFEHDWPSWWCKLELFSHPYLKGKEVVYFDLDTIIQGDITPLVEYDHNFSMLRDFYFKQRFGSGVMAWKGDRSYITKAFNPHKHPKEYVTSENWGDQAFIRDNVGEKIGIIQDVTTVKVDSYKLITKKRGKSLRDCDVLCFHGKPRPRSRKWKV